MVQLLDPALIGAVAAVITAVGALVFRRSELARMQHQTFQEDLDNMRAEVSRLRDDLARRDDAARANHEELTSLRTQVGELQLQVLDLVTGVHVLSRQLTEHNLRPDYRVPDDTAKQA